MMMGDIFYLESEKQDEMEMPKEDQPSNILDLDHEKELNKEDDQVESHGDKDTVEDKDVTMMMDERKLDQKRRRPHHRIVTLRPIYEVEEETGSIKFQNGKAENGKNEAVERSQEISFENKKFKAHLKETQLEWMTENTELLKRIVELQKELTNKNVNPIIYELSSKPFPTKKGTAGKMINETEEMQTGEAPLYDQLTDDSESDADEDLIVVD